MEMKPFSPPPSATSDGSQDIVFEHLPPDFNNPHNCPHRYGGRRNYNWGRDKFRGTFLPIGKGARPLTKAEIRQNLDLIKLRKMEFLRDKAMEELTAISEELGMYKSEP